jgi:hypothetical protein
MTDDFTTAAARLADVLAAENAALAALDLPRAGAMLAEKTRAADAFVAAHALSRGLPNAGGAAPARLGSLVAENQRLLEQAIIVQRRVIGIIARALPRALRDSGTARYGAQGRVASARPVAVAVFARA